MKKLVVIAVVSLFMGSLAWGQSNPKILLNADDDGFIKGTIPDFSYEGKVNLYTIKGFDHAYYGTPIEGQTVDITFLDRQFEAEKTLQIPIELNNVYMHKGERRGFIYHREDDSSLCSYTDDEGNTVDVFTVETAKSYLGYNEDDDWSMETKGNGTYFYSRWTYFFDYEIYGINGTQYPQRSFYWLDEKGHLYNVFYRSYGVHYTGEWVDYESDFRGKSTSTIYWLYYIDYDSGVFSLDYDNCTVTQTLFNNDEKYEYVVPFADGSLSSMWTKDRDGDGEVDSYEKYYGEATAGFHIMSEDGTILNTVTYDGGFEGNNFIIVMKINGKFFLMVSGYVIDENNYTSQSANLIYEIDKQSNSIRKVAEHAGMNVRPAVADESEEITVDLSEESDASEIIVVNAAGQTLKRIPIEAGQKRIKFNTRGLSKGLNVVNARGGKDNLSSKVLIK